MLEIGKFIDFLGQDSIREAIPVITAIGGALVVVLRFIFKVIYAQNMNEIDKVFMNPNTNKKSVASSRISIKIIFTSPKTIATINKSMSFKLVRCFRFINTLSISFIFWA